jgi:hypothetical protein
MDMQGLGNQGLGAGRGKKCEKGPELWPSRRLAMNVREDSSRIAGGPVRSRLRWKLLSWWHREGQAMKDFLFY